MRPSSPPLIAIAVLFSVLTFAFGGLFVTAFHDPQPHRLELAVAGPAGAAAALQRSLDHARPGAFAVQALPSAAAARAAVADADVRGALVLGGPRAVAYVAGAAGAIAADAARAALTQAAAAGARRVRVVDLAPLPSHDARGLSSLFATFSLLLPAVAFGALLTLAGAGARLRTRLLALVTFAVAAGLVAALAVDTVVGALTGAFWPLAGVGMLASLAVAGATHGLGRLAGPAGLGLAALLLIPLGQSSSGGPLGGEFLPSFFATMHDVLPTGQTLVAIRNVVYFDGAGAATPLLVLAAWAVAGVALAVLGRRGARRTAHAPRAASTAVGVA